MLMEVAVTKMKCIGTSLPILCPETDLLPHAIAVEAWVVGL